MHDPSSNGANGSGDSDVGWLALTCRNDAEWDALCDVSGLDHLRRDRRFSTGLQRWKHRDELKPMIEAWTSEQSGDGRGGGAARGGSARQPVALGRGFARF